MRLLAVTKLATFFLLLSNCAFAQTTANNQPDDSFLVKHRELLKNNPQNLSVTLQVKNNQSRFHPGEIIPLELSFASNLSNAYVFDNANYDRSGRLSIDTFVVDRAEAAVDPLHDYFTGGLFMFMGGGLRGIGALDRSPQVVNYELNEWLRFERPGKYRLYVVSGRITKGKPHHSDNTRVSPVSNIVEFEILPRNEQWEQQTLEQALKIVDSGTKASNRPTEPPRASCRVLRFLDTEASIKEIIRRFRGQEQTCDFEFDFGLLGTHRREFAVTQLEAALDDPTQPVTGYFLNALSFLAFVRDQPDSLPPYPVNDESAKTSWQTLAKQRRQSFETVQQKYVGQLAISIKQKQGTAAAISLKTLVEMQSRGGPIDEVTRNELAASLAKVFFDLPADTQRALIEYQWNTISSPAMLPVLRQLYRNPPDLNEIPQPFPGAALLRIYQLAPEEGRQLILDEIRRPDLRVRISVLGVLPDKELPQLEDTIVETAIGRTDETSAALVSRYVSAAALPRLRSAFENQIGRMPCREQASILSYFLRADQNFGLEMVRKALDSRKHTHCYPSVLTDAAGETITPEFEAVALRYLNDQDPELAFSAVRVLCSGGSAKNKPAIKAAIKQRLEDWREKKVDPDASISDSAPFAGYMAESFLRTYAMAIPWITPPDEFKELAELCLNEQCRKQLKPRNLTDESDIQFFYWEGQNPDRRFMLGHYDALSWSALKQKAIQFPKGTRFIWHADNRAKEIDDQLFDELKGYLKEKGFELVRFEPDKNEQ